MKEELKIRLDIGLSWVMDFSLNRKSHIMANINMVKRLVDGIFGIKIIGMESMKKCKY